MTDTNAKERIVVLPYHLPSDMFLVEHAMDETAGFQRWGFPMTECVMHGDVLESWMDGVRRVLRERFGVEMDAVDNDHCYHLTDVHADNIAYEPFILHVSDQSVFKPKPGVTAEWKSFAQLVLLGERKLFTLAHQELLNIANEHLSEFNERYGGDEDEDPDSISEDD